MALILKDRVKQTASAPGTGTITLSGSVTGFQSFSSVGNGNTTYFAIVDPVSGAWEVNYGVYTSSGTTLTRNATPLSSSTGTLVNFTGAVDVFVTYPSENAVWRDTNGVVVQQSFGDITATSAALTSGTITGAPVNATDIVNKEYADSIASGLNYHQPVNYASTAALPTYVYNNGASGVGATITAVGNGALSLGGGSPTATQRVLIKDEVGGNAPYNGVYVVTQAGTSLLPFILTRATDYDTSGTGTNEIDQGDYVLVISGTLASTAWVQQTPLPITVGTTALTFLQFNAPITYTAGTGLNLSPATTFNISDTGVTATTYGSASAVPVFAVNAQGQITSVTNTNIAIAGSAVSGNISGSAGSVANALTAGSYLTSAGSYNGSAARTFAVDATEVNTASKVVARDASGNFSAGTITAALSGNASTATAATNVSGGAANQIPYQTGAATTSFIAAPTTSGTYLGWNGSAFTYSAISTPSSVTFNNGGAGDASGTTFNGSVARTISYNTVGAPSTGGTGATGTWGISISGNAATATSATSASSATFATTAGSVTGQANSATITAATANTASTIVLRDASGNFSAGTITAALNGNASTATTAANVNDGTLTMNVAGTGLSGSQTFTANQSSAATFTVTSNATNVNTASTIVARDASGNFSAGTITAALSGNASTATSATSATTAGSITGQANSATITAASTNTASTIVLRDGSGNFSAGTITAALSGNATTATSATTAGSATTATTSTYSTYLSSVGSYVWNNATASTGYVNGISNAFVSNAEGFPSYGDVMTMNSYPGGSGALQLFSPYGSAYPDLNLRFRTADYSAGGAWTAWKVILDAANYNSYAPTLTGTGASGTWGINITGSAGSAPGYLPLSGGTMTGTITGGSGVSDLVTGNYAGALRGYLYNDTNGFGLLTYAGSWAVRVNYGTNTVYIPGIGYSDASLRAPIFYDSDNTGYYIDPASTSDTALRMRGGALFGPNTTWGAYLSIGTNGNASTSYASVATTNGNLHMDAATGCDIYLNYYAGNAVRAYGSLQTPIVYDLNNSAYYLDPASSSQLATVYMDGWLYKQGTAGIYFTTYSYGIQAAGVTGTYGNITTYGTGANGWNGYNLSGQWTLMNSGNGDNIGIHSNSTSWLWYWDGGVTNFYRGYTQFANSARAPIFYDSANTGYYVVPSSTSNISATYIGGHLYTSYNGYNPLIRASAAGASGLLVQDSTAAFRFQLYGDGTNYGFLGGAWASWDFRKVNGGALFLNNQNTYYYSTDTTYLYRVYGTADMRSPIYYDLDDTAFYTDPASISSQKSILIGYSTSSPYVYNVASTGLITFGTTSDPTNYSILTELENYGGTYSKLRLKWYTGIQYYASQAYGGHRFYDIDGTQYFGIGVGGNWSYSIYSHRAPIFYDLDNTGYYVDPASTSVLSTLLCYGNVTAYYSSDIKFKTNVRDIPNALEIAESIGGKLFDWTDEYIEEHGGEDDYFMRKADFGVIAQDVLKVFPVAVRTRPDGSLAVDYEKLSAVAFAAVASLSTRVKSLEARI